jgi:hypothetical protein
VNIGRWREVIPAGSKGTEQRRVNRLLDVSGAFLREFVDEMFAASVLRAREVFDHSDSELNGRMFYHGGVLHNQRETLRTAAKQDLREDDFFDI